MYRTTGAVSEVQSEQIVHLMDSYQGMSGGPLLRNDPDYDGPFVIAVKPWESSAYEINGANRDRGEARADPCLGRR